MSRPRKRRPTPKSKGDFLKALKIKRKSLAKNKKTADKRRRDRLWTLEAGLTYSSLSRWIENPEEFALQYIDGWTPRRLKKSLEFGSIFHLMLEHQYHGRKKSPATVAKQIAAAYESARQKTILSTEREWLHIICEQCKLIFPLYCEWWKENDESVIWLAREQKFAVPYSFIDLDGKHRTVTLRGMRDGLFEEDGELGVFETKTKDTVNEESIRSQLRADMQTLLYMFTARLEKKKLISRVLYNIIRRPGQQYKNETVSQFIKRIQADIEKNTRHYFKRWEVTVDQKDYDQFEQKTLLPTLRAFLKWHDSLKKNRWESPFHSLNLNALIGRYGKSDFWEMIINGRRSLYYQRLSVFPELDQSILDQ